MADNENKNEGAPAILTTASEWEARAREKVISAEAELERLYEERKNPPPAKDGTDYKALIEQAKERRDDARASWKQLADTVWKFDKSVEPEKRNASESITRSEGVKLVTMFGINMRTATENLLDRIVPEIRASVSNEDGYKACEAALRECFLSSIKSAVKNDILPLWVEEALKGVL